MFKLNSFTRISGFLITFSLLFIACNPKKERSNATETESQSYLKLDNPAHLLPDWSTQNRAVVHILADPDNLHPANGNSQTRAEINLYIHKSLIQTDLRAAALQPGLCTSLPKVSADQLQLTFELKDGIMWDDGSLLTTADVIFTAKVAKCPLTNNPASKPYFENVKEVIVDASNPLKFTVLMKKAYIQNIAIWADYPIIQRAFYDSLNVLSKYSFQQFDDSLFNAGNQKDLIQWAEHFNDPAKGFDPNQINGLGAYKLVSWENGQAITLVKKHNHWTNNSTNYADASGPDQIIFKINRDAASQQLEFKSQNYDGSAYLGVRTLLTLQSDSSFNRNYHSKFMDTYGYTYIALNMKPDGVKHLSLLTDAKVRKALAFTTPVNDIIQVVHREVNKRINGPVSLIKNTYNKNLPLIPFDPAMSAKLLEEAGWKDSDGNGIRDKIINGKKIQLELELAFLSTQVEWKEMAMMISEGMAKAGVKVNPVAYDFPVWMTKASSHDFDMLMGSWNSSVLPDDYSQLWSTQSWMTNGPNYTGFGDASMDKLIDSLNVVFDDKARFTLEQEIQARIYEQQPYIFMYQLVRRCVVHKRFSGAEFYAERPGVTYYNLKVAGGLSSKNSTTAQ